MKISSTRPGAWWRVMAIVFALSLFPQSVGLAADPGGDSAVLPRTSYPQLDEEGGDELLALDDAFISRRLAGDTQLTLQQAGALRAAAAQQVAAARKQGVALAGPAAFNVPWTALGPNPIVQVTRGSGTFTAMSGRIGALAIRPSTGQLLLAAAHGGIWLYDPVSGTWTPKTDNLESLSMGALAIAPSNDAIIYAGTGEGALSGDSYFGNGILKSTDGGTNWTHVSGDYFVAVSISHLVVDPTNANHLYASVLRGRGGSRRTTPAVHSKFGIWESKDGGTSWTLLKEAKNESNGATDIELDPQNPSLLYASFWSDAVYRSLDGGQHWAPFMAGFPAANHAANATRFSLGISHPTGAAAVLYAGFDWQDAGGYHPSRVWKSVNGGAWSLLPAGSGADAVEDYCGGQCFYDNVIEADPSNSNIVYAGGQFNYGIGSGGIFRSDDGGQTWKNLGWDQHPDFHAFAFDTSNPAHILIGSDGGVWFSADRGGRPNASDPLNAVTWVNLNGTVDPFTAAATHRTNLQISQFTSVATVPQLPVRFWGGTQDNGTLRKSGASASWFDVAGGDGGQVLVDPTVDSCALAPSCYVYGTFNGVTPYRFTDGGGFFTRQGITGGINLSDRADFYPPFLMNKLNPSQLFLGTYRLYRTDNARATSAGDVLWQAISPDLTGGCTGTAPNGARTCALSAIGVGGGTAVYVGTLDGRMWISTDGITSASPSWTRLDLGKLPNRPVAQIAVDRSNYRIAYAAYNGFNAATPSRPGHVFKTTDGGQSWNDISGNLPDLPVDSIILDPSFPNTLYAGTDVGPMVTYDGGANWSSLGSGFPIVDVWQLDLDPAHRIMAAGTHGRGAWRIQDTNTIPALVISKVDAGIPIGPSSNLDYTITLRNIGNADATGVTVADPLPAQTSLATADNGGSLVNGTVTWSGLTLTAGTSVDLHFTVSVADALKNKVKAIVNDGIVVTTDQQVGTTGSPTVTPIAAPYAVSLAPASQIDGGRVGTSVPYTLTVRNDGFTPDSYTLSTSGGTLAVTLFASDCVTPLPSTGTLLPGATATVCAEVAIPGDASPGDSSTATVTATSVAAASTNASATITTLVARDTLLVDNDGNTPDVSSYYTTALTTAGVSFDTWDLSVSKTLPLNFLKAHDNVVWFTGNSYPGPILPFEAELASYLDGGGHLFLSGQDLLDQAAGTTAFVHDYLHVDWDGSENQNDKTTAAVHGVAGSPVTNGLGAILIDHTILGNSFEDQITPNGGALAAFTDDSTAVDGLSVDTGVYKVVFIAFPMEAYGTAADKADLITRAYAFFGP